VGERTRHAIPFYFIDESLFVFSGLFFFCTLHLQKILLFGPIKIDFVGI
jgi:hypothetical protein